MARNYDLILGYVLVGFFLVMSVRGGTLKCQQEGRFADPNNCGNYVDCLRMPDGVLQAREGHCHGYPFSAEKKRCVDHSEKPDCMVKGTRISFPNPNYNYECAADKNGAGCSNCGIAFTCINGNATLDFCDQGDVCVDAPEFGGSVCLPASSGHAKDKCTCKGLGLSSDHFNSTYFHFCGSLGDAPEIFACPDGSEFNSDSQECQTAPPPPSCGDNVGTFVNPNDCTYYYSCIPGGIMREGSCGPGYYYNEVSRMCEDGCDFGTATTLTDCTELGNIVHPSGDCTKYLECKELEEPQVEVKCASGFFFDEIAKRCSLTTRPDGCEEKGFDYLSCPGHSDLACA